MRLRHLVESDKQRAVQASVPCAFVAQRKQSGKPPLPPVNIMQTTFLIVPPTRKCVFACYGVFSEKYIDKRPSIVFE